MMNCKKNLNNMNKHEGTWMPNPKATYFVEVWKSETVGIVHESEPNAYKYLPHYLTRTISDNLKTIAVWHITPKPSNNA